MSVTVYDVLDELRESSTSKADQGARLERLMVAFLRTDPTYADQFSDVWLWQDWPHRGGKHDTGIDLVAVDRLTGENVAIQCKFYAPGHHVSKKDIDTFLSASGTTDFAQRIIISTGADWGPNAETTLQKQQVPIRRIGMSDLEASVIDWSQFSWDAPDALQTVGRKVARPHQREAIDAVRAGLSERDRGKLIMACGTGKTFTSLRLAEQMVGAGGQVLFLVPSISLLSQTVREWASEAEVDPRMLAVCSDAKATKRSAAVNEDISAVDIALPATTNLAVLQERWAAAVEDPGAMTVVFSTYQSLDVVSKAQKAGGFAPFDLIVCDEAHRTTGLTLAGEDASMFVKVHDNKVVQGAKRLYMTATPRIFGDESKKKADSAAAVLASMDDEETFGPELHRLGFGEAVERDLLTDYRVLVLAVDETYVADNFQHELATAGDIPLGDAARIVGCWNGLAKQFATAADETDIPMQRAVAFAKDIKASKAVAAGFPAIVDRHLDHLDPEATTNQLRVECEHVDGTFNALERNKRLDWLKADVPEGTCRVLTNARCLSEGVDVPALDAVMFLTPRSSEVDVVQSVGRVMRKSPGKDYGYIILPIVTPSNVAPEDALRDNEKYKVVWQVLQALRAHDDRFNATINQIDLNKKRPNKIRVMGIGHGGAGTDHQGEKAAAEQLEMQWDFGQWQDAIYARIVQKVGERRYWETWAADVATIAQQHITRITGLLVDHDSPAAVEFEKFLDGLRGNLNENITQTDAIEMLAQHLITRPVFEALFGGYDFAEHNPIAQRMEAMLAVLDEHTLDTENSSLEGFYESVRARVDGVDNADGRQRIIVELYDKFFATAFKHTVDKLGIVYTPVEIVDFILRSADGLLRTHFDQGLTDEGVHILDGFTGTGTFITRLLQLGLIDPHDLARKYANEIHANEILLLAYYIAAVNIETTYQELRGSLEQPSDYEPFPGLILTDTFQSYEDGDRDDFTIFPVNSERIMKQRELPITVIVGNPPYSVGQSSANDDNANEKYDKLDGSIRDSYARRASGTLLRNLYDSYIRAIRWASLRLGARGVIAYVTNGGWLDSNTADGMRLTLADEFSDIHIYNLRGNARTAGEQRKREAGNVFGSGGRTTAAITILIRNPDQVGPARVHYTDIGDYLTREQKLEAIKQAATITELDSTSITPNKHGDWLNQRRDDFAMFLPLKGTGTLIAGAVLGVSTSRDAWVYAFSKDSVSTTARRFIDEYESSRKSGLPRSKDPKRISWSRGLRDLHDRGTPLSFSPDAFRTTSYRPFTRQWLYTGPDALERPGPTLDQFKLPNTAIYTVGRNSAVPFSALAVDAPPNLHLTGAGSGGSVWLRWRYEEVGADSELLDVSTGEDDVKIVSGYRCRDNVTDDALKRFREAYGDAITRDDIFSYVYGLLHAPDYRAAYAADLKKMLPRIPLVIDSAPFIAAGRELLELHLGYESAAPFPLDGLYPENVSIGDAAYGFFSVQKMRYAKRKDPETGKRVDDKTTVTYNERITVSGIPEDAHRYMLGSRSAVDWILDRYQVKTDKASGIVNDPNDWSRGVGDPRYILDLLARIVTVSVETMRIVDGLPALSIREEAPEQ